ncbi:hypothetical protein C8R47DRAFT_1210402 [Mycena vitilis]|nr:hypothetical protein C8R47DRAFT_1210402 [Mycena vitilis]
MDDSFLSGSSSPANSSFYGDLSSNEIHRHSPLSMDWARPASPAHSSGMTLSHRASSSFALETRLNHLERENLQLRAENNAYKAAYHELVQAVPALLNVTSNPFSLPVPSADQAGSQVATTLLLAPLSQVDYPLVQFWLRSDFFKRDGISTTLPAFPRGGKLASQGVNVSGRYVDDDSGDMVDGFRFTAMKKLAAGIWFSLREKGRAPVKWSQASIDVSTLYHNEMCQRFPELRYCADNWKSQQIATSNYPSWYNSHGPVAPEQKPKRKKAVVHEQRKKVKLDDENLLSLNPLWDPTPTAASTGAVVEDVEAAIPDSMAPSSEDLASENTPADSAVSTVAPPVPSAAAPVLAAPPLTPPSAEPSHQSYRSPPTIPVPAPPAASLASPATALTAPSTGGVSKKEPRMVAGNTLTPRNLCSKKWIDAKHGSRSEFAAYWTSIVNTDEEKRWNKVAAEAKASAKLNSALATA